MSTYLLGLIALVAFAANSVLCRIALHTTSIDPATFTTIRIISAAVFLSLLVLLRSVQASSSANSLTKQQSLRYLWQQGTWSGMLALFAYAALFSFAYIELTAATGALILFGWVQFTMLVVGFYQGARFTLWQWLGFILAVVGILALFLPSATQPDLWSAILMAGAGIAWGIYSLLGKGVKQPLLMTQGNFLKSVPLTLLLSIALFSSWSIDMSGVLLALGSGILASGVGYAVWYAVLPNIQATEAATMQLSVPVIATIGGVVLLDEPLTLVFVLAACAILGGIFLVLRPSFNKL
jgi:drug/metabolite transporter (DMT)-like permease